MIRNHLFSFFFCGKVDRLTQSRPDDFAVTRVLVGAALEADGEDGEEGYVAHCVWFLGTMNWNGSSGFPKL